jgi:hypothetical protein
MTVIILWDDEITRQLADFQKVAVRQSLDTIEYSIEDTYQGLYQQLRGYLGKSGKGRPLKPVPVQLCYARLWSMAFWGI